VGLEQCLVCVQVAYTSPPPLIHQYSLDRGACRSQSRCEYCLVESVERIRAPTERADELLRVIGEGQVTEFALAHVGHGVACLEVEDEAGVSRLFSRRMALQVSGHAEMHNEMAAPGKIGEQQFAVPVGGRNMATLKLSD